MYIFLQVKLRAGVVLKEPGCVLWIAVFKTDLQLLKTRYALNQVIILWQTIVCLFTILPIMYR